MEQAYSSTNQNGHEPPTNILSLSRIFISNVGPKTPTMQIITTSLGEFNICSVDLGTLQDPRTAGRLCTCISPVHLVLLFQNLIRQVLVETFL